MVRQIGRGVMLPRDRWTTLRVVVAILGCIAALRLFFPPAPVESAVVLLIWGGLGFAIGLAIGRRWALLLAPLPWLGIWYTRATGPEYLSRPNDFPEWLSLTLIALPGLIGLAVGIGARRALGAARDGRWADPARVAGRLALVAAILVPLGAVALDRGPARRFLRPVAPLTMPRHDEGAVRAAATGLDFPVYGAPPTEGVPTAALRGSSSPPGLGPTRTFTLIYCDDRCRRSSEVQIMSAPPQYGPAARQTGGTIEKPIPIPPTEPVEIAGVTWQLVGDGPRGGAVSADAILANAYVRISAPDRATFARVAAGLRRVGP